MCYCGINHPTGTVILLQRCHNVVARQKMGVVPTLVSDVVTTSLSDIIKTMPQRYYNVATTFSIGFLGHFNTGYSVSFHSSNRERVTKVLSGIKHTSSLFKRTLHLQLTKVYTNQVKYMKFNLFTMNSIIHFFT